MSINGSLDLMHLMARAVKFEVVPHRRRLGLRLNWAVLFLLLLIALRVYAYLLLLGTTLLRVWNVIFRYLRRWLPVENLCPRPPLTFSTLPLPSNLPRHRHDDARPKSAPAHHPPSTVHVTESTPADVPACESAQKTKIQRARVGGGDVLATPAARHVGAGRACAQDRHRVHLLC